MAPHGWPNVGALDADIYLFSAYKTWGPHQGIMTVKRDLALRLPNQGHFFNAETLTKRLTPAGPDHATIAASAGMADYLEAVHGHHFGFGAKGTEVTESLQNLFASHEQALLQPLLDHVSSKNSVRVLGPTSAATRAATLALACNRPGAALAAALADQGIMAGGGHFYAVRALKALGIDPEHGVLRLS